MQTICTINLKGGTGKTATAVNLAAELMRRGKTVLTIDADPQHNSTDFWGCIRDSVTLSDVLDGECSLFAAAQEINVPELGTLLAVPADMRLVELGIARMMGGTSERSLAVAKGLAEMDGAADFAVIDCPPSFTAASVAALLASDWVVVPVTVDPYSLDGLTALLDQLDNLQGHGAGMQLAGTLLTRATRTRASQQMGALLGSVRRYHAFTTEIPRSVAVPESMFARTPLCQYAPGSKVAEAYESWVDELLDRIGEEAAG